MPPHRGCGARTSTRGPSHRTLYTARYCPDAARLATVEVVESPGRPVRIRVIDAADGWVLNDVCLIGSRVTAVTFGPDGHLLAAGSADKTVRIWDLATGQESRTLIGHSDWVTDVSLGPDGSRLVSSNF